MPLALLHTLARWLDLPKAPPETHLALQPEQEQPVVNSQRKLMSASGFILQTLSRQRKRRYSTSLCFEAIMMGAS